MKFSDRSVCEFYSTIGIDRTIINQHADDPTVHDKITQLNGSFGRTIKGLDEICMRKQPLAIKFIVNATNASYLPNWARLVSQRFPNSFSTINGLALWGQSNDNIDDLAIPFEDTADLVSEAADVLIERGMKFGIFSTSLSV